jgi:hypothetical protein
VAQHGIVETERAFEFVAGLGAALDVQKHVMRLVNPVDGVGQLPPAPVFVTVDTAALALDDRAVALDHRGHLFALVGMDQEHHFVMTQGNPPFGYKPPGVRAPLAWCNARWSKGDSRSGRRRGQARDFNGAEAHGQRAWLFCTPRRSERVAQRGDLGARETAVLALMCVQRARTQSPGAIAFAPPEYTMRKVGPINAGAGVFAQSA